MASTCSLEFEKLNLDLRRRVDRHLIDDVEEKELDGWWFPPDLRSGLR